MRSTWSPRGAHRKVGALFFWPTGATSSRKHPSIHSSTEQVENGAILVKDAGQTMAGIVESVGRVATLMSEIAQATREQNQGIISIHQSMT